MNRDLRQASTGSLAPGTGAGLAIGVWKSGERRVFTYGAAKQDSFFEIGSISKTFTGLMLARMVAQGKVRFDEPVRELLPPGTVSKPGAQRLHSSTSRRITRGCRGCPAISSGGPDQSLRRLRTPPALRIPGEPRRGETEQDQLNSRTGKLRIAQRLRPRGRRRPSPAPSRAGSSRPRTSRRPGSAPPAARRCRRRGTCVRCAGG